VSNWIVRYTIKESFEAEAFKEFNAIIICNEIETARQAFEMFLKNYNLVFIEYEIGAIKGFEWWSVKKEMPLIFEDGKFYNVIAMRHNVLRLCDGRA